MDEKKNASMRRTIAALIKAAEGGTGAAARELGDHYREGNGVARDAVQALHWYSVGAALGNADAQNNLGSMLVNGAGGTADAAAAVRWFAASAQQGHPMAQYNLGKRYLHGDGVALDDQEALYWFAKAARQKEPHAVCELGTMYRLGRGTQPDLQRAAELHLAVAQTGDPVALGNLSDYREDLAKLALDGKRQAAFALCRMYDWGLGVDRHPAETWGWVRWAHDGCAPLPDEAPDSVRINRDVAGAFRCFRGGLTGETRRQGERLLAERLTAAGKPPEGRSQIVLQVGSASGNLTLIGQWAPVGWQFRLQRWGELANGQQTDTVTSWRSPLRAIDAWPWHNGCPVKVHPEFAERFWQAYRCRARTEGNGAHLEQWRQACGKETVSPEGEEI